MGRRYRPYGVRRSGAVRVLVLCPRVPYPPVDGGRIAMWSLARSLAGLGHEVTILALNPRKHRVDVAALAPEDRERFRLRAVDVDTTVRPLAALANLFTPDSLHVARFVSPEMERLVEEVLSRETFDVVQLESPFVGPYLPAVRRGSKAPVALRAVNVEFRIWERLAAQAKDPIRGAYLSLLARRLRRHETRLLAEVDALVPVTQTDAATFRALGAASPIHVAPVGVDGASYPSAPGSGEADRVVFLGSLDWRPNREGVEWFLARVWPLVRARRPAARFAVAGSEMPAGWGERVAAEGVEMVGYVEDARRFLLSGAAMAVPLLSGGGMRVKIVEGMALGRAVVSTTVGAEGLDVTNGEELLLADAPELFAERLLELLSDRALATRLGAAGRRLVETRYDADAIARELAAFYASLLPPTA